MKTIIIFALLPPTLSSFAQEKECANFKTGTFKYTDADYADLITKRNDSIQVDSYPNANFEMTSKITWLTDCRYEIEYIIVNDASLEPIIGMKYVIEIMEIDDSKIICRTKSEGITVEKEMIKVNED